VVNGGIDGGAAELETVDKTIVGVDTRDKEDRLLRALDEGGNDGVSSWSSWISSTRSNSSDPCRFSDE
jgi:hypothetical protein